MHSIELLLDPVTDDAVRQEWHALREADLPSQATHTGATNAPHLTLLARSSIDGSRDDDLRRVFAELPLVVEFGGLVVFGRPPRGFVLARLVVVTPRLLRLHELVHEVLAADLEEASDQDPSGQAAQDQKAQNPRAREPGAQEPARIRPREASHALPGHWTPHVTLASRLDAAQIAAALTVLDAPPSSSAPRLAAGRRWDSTARTVTPL